MLRESGAMINSLFEGVLLGMWIIDRPFIDFPFFIIHILGPGNMSNLYSTENRDSHSVIVTLSNLQYLVDIFSLSFYAVVLLTRC